MPRLYVGNPTKQNFSFMYREPETAGFPLRTITIGMGSQVCLPGDLSTPQIEAIIQQHVGYGLMPVEAVGKTKKFMPLVYALDKAISVAKLAEAIQHNTDVLIGQGKTMRQEAAVADAVRIENDLQETQGGILRNFEASVVDETAKDDTGFAEGTRVTRFEPRSAPSNKGRRRAA
jgi:hypothetical protein